MMLVKSLPASESKVGLESLIQLVSAWSNESLLIPIVSEVIHQLTIGVTEYIIGPYTGILPIPDNWIDTPRPKSLKAAFLRDGSGTDYQLEIMDVNTYSRISRKLNSSRPGRFYQQIGWPTNLITFEAAPYDSETLHLFCVQPLQAILPLLGLTEVIDLPEGYERALIYNLALDLAPNYGKDISNVVAVTAVESKKNDQTCKLPTDRIRLRSCGSP